MIHRKTEQEIAVLKESGIILGTILRTLAKQAKEGVTLQSLDDMARSMAEAMDAYPTFLGYQPEGARHPFPAAICASLNDVVVHGIPSGYTLKKGDVLKIDMGITYKGLITDSATTVVIGSVSKDVNNLIAATKKALEKGIAAARAGNTLGDIGYAIQQVAKEKKVYVVDGLTGHGVGYELHEDPIIYNVGKKGEGPVLKEGLVLAIEPMFALGTNHIVQTKDEGYASADGSMTAHFEHTIVVRKGSPLVLTQ